MSNRIRRSHSKERQLRRMARLIGLEGVGAHLGATLAEGLRVYPRSVVEATLRTQSNGNINPEQAETLVATVELLWGIDNDNMIKEG